MLTTADWLLGSNSQSAAGLSTLSDRMERWEHLLFSTLSEWRHDVQKQNIVPDTLQTSSVTLVPSIQKGCCNCGILFRAWFNTDWIWLPCLRMVRFFFYLIYFYIWMSQAASSIVFFVLSVFRACPLPLLFHRCEESPPPPPGLHMNQHRWNMYDMTASCFFNRERFHRAWLPCPHCRLISHGKKWKGGGGILLLA